MKPFLQGRKAAENPLLRVVHPSGSSSPLAHPSSNPHSHSPTVEAVKQGDKVVRLVITCGCGERIEVDCLYPPGN